MTAAGAYCLGPNMPKINLKKIISLPRGIHQERLGIDFSSGSLKLAQVKAFPNKKEVINLKSHDIRDLSDDAIAKLISAAFSELKIKNAAIVNVIPAQAAITKNIEIPSVDPKEIKEIVSLQAGRHTPYSREEIITDYINIGTYKHSYTKILLVIVSRNIVKRQFSVLEKAGLKLERVFFAPEGLAWSAQKLLGLNTENSPASILHIDDAFTDFVIVFKDKAMFIRSIPIGALHLSAESEKYQMKFLEELKKSLEAYQSENIERSPAMLILTGATEELSSLEQTLNNYLRLPCKIIPYLKNIAVSAPALDSACLTKRISFLNVLTPLLAWNEMNVDLLPEEIKLKQAVEERGKDLIRSGILIFAVFVLVFSILVSKIYFKGAYLERLKTEFASVNRQAEALEKDFSKISTLRNYFSGRGYSLEVLAELYASVPEDLELNEIRFDIEGAFSLRGTAATMSSVFSFVERLEKTKYFKDVKTRYTARRKEGLIDVTDFEITSLLHKE